MLPNAIIKSYKERNANGFRTQVGCPITEGPAIPFSPNSPQNKGTVLQIFTRL